jgi:hypothetical protein
MEQAQMKTASCTVPVCVLGLPFPFPGAGMTPSLASQLLQGAAVVRRFAANAKPAGAGLPAKAMEQAQMKTASCTVPVCVLGLPFPFPRAGMTPSLASQLLQGAAVVTRFAANAKPAGAGLPAKAMEQAQIKTAPFGAVRPYDPAIYLRASAHDFSSSL